MKKTLLLILIAGVWSGSQAQNSAPVKSNHATGSPAKAAMMRYKASIASETTSTTRNTKGHHKISAPPLLPPMGSSANVNTSRYTPSTQLTANQACNLIVMTHREDNTKVGTCGTGAYEEAYSLNDGALWDTSIVMNCNSPTRYPNGALFNPNGNTNPMNVYDAYMGAWNNGSTTANSWTAEDFGSVTVAGTNLHTMYWQNTGGPGFNENGGNCIGYESSSDDSTVHGIGEGWTSPANNYVTWTGAVLTTGKFNSVTDSFNWTQTLFRPHLVPAIKGFATNSYPFDSMAYPLGQPGTAWSQDGKTGYVVIFGNLDSSGVGYNYNFVSYQPIVYRTGDAGKTWAMMPMFNFRNCPNLTTYLYPTADSGIKTPMWDLYTYYGGATDFDLTVDYKGNLHILGTVISQYWSNPDSAYDLTWFRGQHGYIYDVYNTTPTGGWNARYIDSMMTYPTNIITSSFSTDWDNTTTGYVSMENRMQASRSTDGKRIFCTWVDDFTGVVADSLVAPDVKSEGYNISSGKAGPVIVFTSTSNNYFLSVSDIAMSSGSPDTTWTVPCAIVYPETTPDDGTEPVNHFYLGSVQFNDSLALSVPTIAKQGFSISQNFPNPFSNVTNFNISLTNESVVSVDVYNMVGQKVSSIAAQKMSMGTHLMTINANGWNAGVYFYKVTANNSAITQKMIVQ